MAARHMTGTEFLTQSGFGQAGDGVVASFPEYPPHNTKLTALLAKSGDASAAQSVSGLLLQARQLHEQGNFAGEQQALVQADQLLDQLLAGGPAGSGKALLVVVLIALAALAWFLSDGFAGTPKKRLPPPRRNARRQRRTSRKKPPPDPDPDSDEDADADDEDD